MILKRIFSNHLFGLIARAAISTFVLSFVPMAFAQAPAITVRPLSKVAMIGQAISFSITATGAQPLTYQWMRNGQIIAGAKHGRRSPGDITIADLTGTGVQDTAIATLARDRARAAKSGTIFES